VALINRNDCEAEERFNVIQKIEPAKIKDIQSDGDKIIVTPLNEGDYEYSLDGVILNLAILSMKRFFFI